MRLEGTLGLDLVSSLLRDRLRGGAQRRQWPTMPLPLLPLPRQDAVGPRPRPSHHPRRCSRRQRSGSSRRRTKLLIHTTWACLLPRRICQRTDGRLAELGIGSEDGTGTGACARGQRTGPVADCCGCLQERRYGSHGHWQQC